MKWIIIITLILDISFFSSKAIGGVNDKNGNFYITYTDFYINDLLEVSRTYNSKSVTVGLFGFGWGSSFETRLFVDPSGLPVIYQNGQGAVSYFKPIKSDEKYEKQLNYSLEKMQKLLVDEKLDNNKDNNVLKNAHEDIKEKLKDAEFRTSEWDRLVRQNKVKPIDVALGTEFTYTCTCNFKAQHLIRTIDGYRYTSEGKTDIFDNEGRLVSLADNSGKALNIERDQSDNGRIRGIHLDSDSIYFFYNDQGFIDRLFNPKSGKITIYSYRDKNLILSNDLGANIYQYLYDARHNMTQIVYIDQSKMSIGYDKNSLATEVIDRDGTKTSYYYGTMNGSPELNYFTEIVRLSPKTYGYPSKERREYHLKITDSGTQVNNEIVTVSDNIKRVYSYDDKGILKHLEQKSPPDSKDIISSDFVFDDSGRVQSIHSNKWSRDYVYSSSASNSSIKSLLTINGIQNSEYSYEYDDKGRLIIANHAGTNIQVIYIDNKSELVASIQSDQDKINFVREGRMLSRLEFECREGGLFSKLEFECKNGQTEIILFDKDKNGQLTIGSDEVDKAYLISSVISGMLSIVSPSKSNLRL
ncbi:DUF6531 domain-containing protein [Methylomonas sp. 11b]|uniref:DUF6531 domain-containing protein n=1 Tax=Methylomonas sp. 11b TaxID=1168169 RepID=UPI0004B0BB15|nr:DUF6531 domain-containing protein [Methylomonas sp. 11b]